MADLIERLRTKCKMLHTCVEMRREAADALEAKDAEIERLRKAAKGVLLWWDGDPYVKMDVFTKLQEAVNEQK